MVDDGRQLDPAAVRAILDERARMLARPASTDEADQTIVLAVLRLGDEQFGIDLRSIREIQRCDTITRLPGTPAFWRGLVNLRGRLLPVLDLARFLELPDTAVSEDHALVIVEAAGLEVALAVEGMPEIRRLRQNEVRPPVYEAIELRTPTRGVTSDLLSLIDIPALLSDPRLVVHAS